VLTNPMEQSSFWEAASCIATEEISGTLWNRVVH
jgi:hypothetical protein